MHNVARFKRRVAKKKNRKTIVSFAIASSPYVFGSYDFVRPAENGMRRASEKELSKRAN